MAMFFGVSRDSVGTLFSSLGTMNNKNNSVSNMSSLLSDYSSIRNGSYKKLVTAYYSKINTDDIDSKDSKKTTDSKKPGYDYSASISTAKDDTETLTDIQESTADLKDAANGLLAKGSKSVFTKEDGEYNTDKIYENVKAFVDGYNDVVKATEDTNTKSVATNMKSMINQTEINKNLLSEIGITINEDNTLALNEKDFKEADMDTVKTMFNGTGSYGYQISSKASMINFNAEYEATRANTYTNKGSYSNNYNTGSLYDSLF